MENMIHERQDEKTAMDETIEKLQEEKQTHAQKITELEQEVKSLESSLCDTLEIVFAG